MSPSIVQFVHSGQEVCNNIPLNSPVNLGGDTYDFISPWNCGQNKDRLKYIVNPGEYVDNGVSKKDPELHLCCQAEWPSLCRRRGFKLFEFEHLVKDLSNNPNVPNNLKQQYFTMPSNACSTGLYVFGRQFMFTCCPLIKKVPSYMYNLEPGSLILFCSYRCVDFWGPSSKIPFFWLDTVFVVDKACHVVSIDYKGRSIKYCQNDDSTEHVMDVSDLFWRRVIEPILAKAKGLLSPSTASNAIQLLNTQSIGASTAGMGAGAPTALNFPLTIYEGKVFNPNNPNAPYSFIPINEYCRDPWCFPAITDAIRVYNFPPTLLPTNKSFQLDNVQDGLVQDVWKEIWQKCSLSNCKYIWHLDE